MSLLLLLFFFFQSTYVRECRFRNPESWALESEIQHKESGIQVEIQEVKEMKKRFRQEKLFCKKRRTLEAMAIPTLPHTPKGQNKVTRPELSNRPKNDHVRIKS